MWVADLLRTDAPSELPHLALHAGPDLRRQPWRRPTQVRVLSEKSQAKASSYTAQMGQRWPSSPADRVLRVHTVHTASSLHVLASTPGQGQWAITRRLTLSVAPAGRRRCIDCTLQHRA